MLGKRNTREHAITKTIFAIIVSALVTLVLVEAGLALMGYGEPILYRIGGKYQYRLVPNQKKRMLGPLVEINSLGMRGPEPDPAKEKIVFFGDSITYGGNGLPDKATFVSLINERLSNTKYQALNAGVNGYGPENIKEFFLFLRENLEFSRVVVVIPTVDLARPLFTEGFFNIYEEGDLFLSRSHLFFKVIIDSLRVLAIRLVQTLSPGHNITSLETRNAIRDSIALQNIQSYQSIIDNSPKVLVFFVPSRSENTGESFDSEYKNDSEHKNQFIESFSRHNGNAKIVDLAAPLRPYGSTIYRDEDHFNEDGHKVLSDLMLQSITRSF